MASKQGVTSRGPEAGWISKSLPSPGWAPCGVEALSMRGGGPGGLTTRSGDQGLCAGASWAGALHLGAATSTDRTFLPRVPLSLQKGQGDGTWGRDGRKGRTQPARPKPATPRVPCLLPPHAALLIVASASHGQLGPCIPWLGKSSLGTTAKPPWLCHLRTLHHGYNAPPSGPQPPPQEGAGRYTHRGPGGQTKVQTTRDGTQRVPADPDLWGHPD